MSKILIAKRFGVIEPLEFIGSLGFNHLNFVVIV